MRATARLLSPLSDVPALPAPVGSEGRNSGIDQGELVGDAMGMTDPIADLLTRIRNGAHARKEQVDVPWSTIKARLVEVLTAEGFLKEHSIVEQQGRRLLRVWLKYDSQSKPVISGLRRVSKPSLRVYVGAKEIPAIRRGLGVNVLSTPAGILTDREARKRNLGGEILCSVW
jgi:small subunit ribosomal protein S8